MWFETWTSFVNQAGLDLTAQLTLPPVLALRVCSPHPAPSVLLVCILLKTSDVENLFMCVTVIFVCHLWRNAHVRNQIVLLHSWRHPFCVLCDHQICDWQLSHPVPCPPQIPLVRFCLDPTCLVLLRSHLSGFAFFLVVHLLSYSRNSSSHTAM